jgi:hypothetical protein
MLVRLGTADSGTKNPGCVPRIVSAGRRTFVIGSIKVGLSLAGDF